MIDIEIIRNNPEILHSSGQMRGQSFPIEQLVDLDQTKRSKIVSVDALRAKRNSVSKQLSSVKDKPQELIEEMRDVGSQIKVLEDEIKKLYPKYKVGRLDYDTTRKKTSFKNIISDFDFSESDKCLALSPSTKSDFGKKPYSLFLYVNEKN